MIITASEELTHLTNNAFLGVPPQMKNSTIIFAENSRNNILFCTEKVCLFNSKITFNGSNSIIFLCNSRNDYTIHVSVYENNVLYIGSNNYFNGCLNIILSEGKHCFIGDGCLFSFDIWIRNADPHLIYACDTKQRLNRTKSVFIGDHVWIGQHALILKGTQIDSGSIIGGMSVVSGKRIPNNSSWAGNPCKLIKKGIFWDGACVHGWTKNITEKSLTWDTYAEGKAYLGPESYVYQFDQTESIPYEQMEAVFDQYDIKKKLEYLQSISHSKNRFAHIPDIQRKRFPFLSHK